MTKKQTNKYPKSHSTQYTDYLESDKWKSLRASCFKATNNKCVGCGDKCTNLHHLSYDNLGRERLAVDVVPLCHKCHRKCHFKKYWNNKKNRAEMTDLLIKKCKLMMLNESPPQKISSFSFKIKVKK